MREFELDLGEVRKLLRSEITSFPEAKISERQVDSFTIFRINGPDATAAFELTISPDTEHFEFSVGSYVVYEGDYKQYPPTLNFVRELIHAVTQARISERRYHFFGQSFGKAARVVGCVIFESYKPYCVSKALSWFSPLARFKENVSYAPYEKARKEP